MMRAVITANGSTPVQYGNGGVAVAVASGAFGGGTLNLEIPSDNEQTWVIDTGFALSADDIKTFYTPRDMPYRFTLVGATAPNIELGVYSS